MVVRSNELIYKSKPQQHQFNYPFQLTYISPSLLEEGEIEPKNDLKKIETGKINVQDDDLVILGKNKFKNSFLKILKI